MGFRQNHREFGGILILMSLICTCSSLSSKSTHSDVTITDIIDGLKARSVRLNSMKLRAKGFVYDIPSKDQLDDPSYIKICIETKNCMWIDTELFRKGEKYRAHVGYIYENIEKGALRRNYITWDGTRNRAYLSDWKDVGSGGVVKDFATGLPGFDFNCFEYNTLELKGCLESHIEPLKWTIIGSERIGQYTTVHIAGPVEAHPNSVLHAWIDLAHDFAPVQLKLENTDNESSQELSDSKLESVDGVWVRTAFKIVVCNPVLIEGAQVTHYLIKGIEVGIDMPDKFFELEFPAGITVVDKITMVTSKVTTDGDKEGAFYIDNPAAVEVDTYLQDAEMTAEQRTLEVKNAEPAQEKGDVSNKAVDQGRKITLESYLFVGIIMLAVAMWLFVRKAR